MADEKAAGAPALTTNIETGGFDEKRGQAPPPQAAPKGHAADDEEEDEDIDALIEDLESEDGHQFEEEEETQPGGGRIVPEDMLQTDSRVGLTESEVLARRRKYGLNQMKEEKENLILKFFSFFVGPIQFVMEGAAVLAAGLEDWVDFGVICGLLLLNACVGFIQEYQAGSIVEELKKTLALKAVVLRDGTLKEVEAPEVVPGDILQVEDGSIIPADGRIVTEDAFLQVDQSALTGESLAVDKHKGDNCFASSAVKRGEAFLIVTSTGDNTFVGRAAALVSQSAGGTGHFTEVLNGIGTILLVLVIVTLLVVWISSFYRSNPIVEILRFTLAITIVGVPVGLPAVVTTTMAVGAAYLAKKQAIVQKLSAIESLAGVEILCSDKTGTLTKNKLSLAEPYTVAGVEPDDLMLTACLAASRKAKGIDAIDKAFLKSLKFYPRAKSVLSKYKVIEFQPFDPVSKKVTAIVESPQGERIICVKGAPLFVLKTVEEDHPIPEDVDRDYKNCVAEFATRGFRSLGVARKRGEGAWEILGIMPCSDPPRHQNLFMVYVHNPSLPSSPSEPAFPFKETMIISFSTAPFTSSTSSVIGLINSKSPTSEFTLKPNTQFSKYLLPSCYSLCSSPCSSSYHRSGYGKQFFYDTKRCPYRQRHSFRAGAFPGSDIGMLQSAQSVLEAAAVLTAIIVVHESGHFLAAYLQGIHVSKFSVGFGPVLAKFNADNVEYSLRAFPLGGFVGFPDNDPDSDIPVDDENLLKNRPIFDRVLVISAGVIANIIFAYSIIFVQVLSVGLPVQEAFPGVLVPEVRAASAAARDGLLPGDVILAVNGIELPKTRYSSVSEIVNVIKKNPRRNVLLKVERGQQDFEIGVTPDESLDGTGRIGVQLSPNVKVSKIRPNNILDAIRYSGSEFWGLLYNVLDSLKQTFLNFSQSASKVSGPVAIIAVGAEVARSDIAGLYQFAAVLNINLAVINLLPLPALDGGSLALILVEAARGGRKLPQEVEQRIMSSGIMVVILLGLFLIIRDTLNLDFIKML